MPILGTVASQFAGKPFSSFESIATYTVGGTNQTSIEFTSIPATFKHLQIRSISRDSRASVLNSLSMQINGDTGNNYTYHTIIASDSGLDSEGGANSDRTDFLVNAGGNAIANLFAGNIWDILDYTNTNKYKTIKMLGGIHNNDIGRLNFTSSLWLNSSAITSLKFIMSGVGAGFTQYTQFALYGIKGA